MQYPATFTQDDGYIVVTFRDIPEAITQGETHEEALEMAHDALQTALEFYFEDNRTVPMPSPITADDVAIELPLSVWSKVLLLNTMLSQHITQAELAKRMGIKPQQVTRIVDLSHATKIDTIANAFKALGKQMQVAIY